MSELDLPKRLIEFGDKAGALKELTRIVQADPKNVDAWFLMIDALDDPAKKVDCYRQILRLEPDNQFALIHYQKLVNRPFVNEDFEEPPKKPQPKPRPQPASVDDVAEFRQVVAKKGPARKQPANRPQASSAQMSLFGLDYQTTIVAGILGFVVIVLLLFVVVVSASGVLGPAPTPRPTRIVLPPTWTPAPTPEPTKTPIQLPPTWTPAPTDLATPSGMSLLLPEFSPDCSFIIVNSG